MKKVDNWHTKTRNLIKNKFLLTGMVVLLIFVVVGLVSAVNESQKPRSTTEVQNTNQIGQKTGENAKGTANPEKTTTQQIDTTQKNNSTQFNQAEVDKSLAESEAYRKSAEQHGAQAAELRRCNEIITNATSKYTSDRDIVIGAYRSYQDALFKEFEAHNITGREMDELVAPKRDQSNALIVKSFNEMVQTIASANCEPSTYTSPDVITY